MLCVTPTRCLGSVIFPLYNGGWDQLENFFRVEVAEGGMSRDAACVFAAHQQPGSLFSVSQTDSGGGSTSARSDTSHRIALLPTEPSVSLLVISYGCISCLRLLTLDCALVAALNARITPTFVFFLGNWCISTAQREPLFPPSLAR